MTDAYIGTTNARAQKLWSARLAIDWPKKSFFAPRFKSTDKFENIIVAKEDLTRSKGDAITVGISAKLNNDFLASGQKVDGNEDRLTTFTDQVVVDECNAGIVEDSMITEQRAFYNMSEEMYSILTTKTAEAFDKKYFTALDSQNTTVVYNNQGTFSATATLATATSAVTAADTLTPQLLTNVKPALISGFAGRQPFIEPVMIDGMAFWVVIAHPDVLASLENDSTFLQGRQFALERGKDNPIFSGAFTVWNQFIVFAHQNIATGTNNSSIPYAQCHILGKGALVEAWAKKPVVEKKKPAYDQQEHGWGMFSLFGVKKTQFNSKDYGSVNLVVARKAISDITYS